MPYSKPTFTITITDKAGPITLFSTGSGGESDWFTAHTKCESWSLNEMLIIGTQYSSGQTSSILAYSKSIHEEDNKRQFSLRGMNKTHELKLQFKPPGRKLGAEYCV